MQRIFFIGGVVVALIAIIVLVFYPTDDPPAVRRKFEDRARAELAGYEVASVGNAALYVGKGDAVLAVDLGPLQQICHTGRNACKQASDELIAAIRKAAEASAPQDVSALRPVLFGPPVASPLAAKVLSEPLADELTLRYGFFSGPLVRYVTPGVATALQLERKNLRARAVEEMEAAPDVPVLRPLLGRQGVSFLDGQADPAAQVLSAARMSVLAQRTGVKRAYIAVPTRGMILMASANDAKGLEEIRAVTAAMFQAPGAEPVSPRIYLYEAGALKLAP